MSKEYRNSIQRFTQLSRNTLESSSFMVRINMLGTQLVTTTLLDETMQMVVEKTDDYETAIDNLNEVRPVIGEKWYKECTGLLIAYYTELRNIQREARAMTGASQLANPSIPRNRPYLLEYRPSPGTSTQNQSQYSQSQAQAQSQQYSDYSPRQSISRQPPSVQPPSVQRPNTPYSKRGMDSSNNRSIGLHNRI